MSRFPLLVSPSGQPITSESPGDVLTYAGNGEWEGKAPATAGGLLGVFYYEGDGFNFTSETEVASLDFVGGGHLSIPFSVQISSSGPGAFMLRFYLDNKALAPCNYISGVRYPQGEDFIPQDGKSGVIIATHIMDGLTPLPIPQGNHTLKMTIQDVGGGSGLPVGGMSVSGNYGPSSATYLGVVGI